MPPGAATTLNRRFDAVAVAGAAPNTEICSGSSRKAPETPAGDVTKATTNPVAIRRSDESTPHAIGEPEAGRAAAGGTVQKRGNPETGKMCCRTRTSEGVWRSQQGSAASGRTAS